MISASAALAAIPAGLRDPLIAEYKSIVQNFMEHRWLPSELGGGRFSEIVYTILDGHAKTTYPTVPKKPANFLAACQKLESNALPHVPRSFQILIPRILPALYEVRNNRSVGHIGGEVNPNHMDAVAVLSICNWVMAELVRVYHGLSVPEAQQVVDALAEVRIPAVWSDGSIKRVLQPTLSLADQILLLIATSLPSVTSEELLKWSEASDKAYFMKILRGFHKKRLVEFDQTLGTARILPPGAQYVQDLVRRKHLSKII
jgi:hypothetical protein